MKVAVVHNSKHDGVINHFGQPCPEKYSMRHVQMVADALQANGHHVKILEADLTLLEELRRFMQSDTSPSCPTCIVFNMAYGIQGDARYTHLPAMLEMAGVPYTGSSPLGHSLALDKVVTKILMHDADVPTPAYQVLSGRSAAASDRNRSARNTSRSEPRFPLVVKPRHESTSYGLRLVRNQCELDVAVEAILREYAQDALVEEYIDGREVCIGLLGNESVEFLPPVELDFGGRDLRLMTWDDKYHKRTDEPLKICPAPLDASTIHALNALALATFRACHCRDYARVDIRIDAAGLPFVLEINSMASLGDGGSYVTSAKAAGYDFNSLVGRILDVTHQRYFGCPPPRDADKGIPAEMLPEGIVRPSQAPGIEIPQR